MTSMPAHAPLRGLFPILALLVWMSAANHGGAAEPRQLRHLVDIPTAGTLARGTVGVDLRMYPNGGVLSGLSFGLLHRLMATVYYGGENLIGSGDINWNPEPGVDVRFRIIEETLAFPAVLIGFTNQGWGAYQEQADRYSIKARGFYAVASRNYDLLGNLGFHGGVNYSLERDDGDEDLNAFVGADKGFLGVVEVLVDYDFAFNDNEATTLGRNNGYFNAGVVWNATGRFSFELDFRNLSANRRGTRDVDRVIKVEYRYTF